MAIIVRHKIDKQKYILLGTGYGMAQSSAPSRLLGHISTNHYSKEGRVIVIADKKGKIYWVPAQDLEVVLVDGVSPQ